MNREQKSAAVAEIADQIQESDAIFAVDYRGISVTQVAELRNQLRAYVYVPLGRRRDSPLEIQNPFLLASKAVQAAERLRTRLVSFVVLRRPQPSFDQLHVIQMHQLVAAALQCFDEGWQRFNQR